ncbi:MULTISPECIES: sigma-70 family RNA polymerase sigma factor [unclassified Dysgonomonas]|uniref:RNA polymerase sigma factor n=1 Tax=unclassified Dysgonomonas TaxID=2630389 RepID=UPI002474DF48|nr:MULTISPECIES: sigma-70 family RNA polymerase sigma factor [unclassified Dysgonomonas]MDL2303217.1 sigma-70 family RNA polymerase sigma factor [Dysgonomonas sp. OttesenSCG-928-D17]
MSRFLIDNEKYNNLWVMFTDGDDNAFSDLYKLSYKMLYSYGLSFQITEELVRDIIQDLFVKLYTKPDLIKNFATIKPFLLASMRNACINTIKANKKYSGLEKIESFELNFTVDENRVEQKEEQDRINTLVTKVLSQLTVRQKEIIYLRFLHQMDYEEISRVMNLSEQAARNLTYRAFSKIRKNSSDYDLGIFLILIVYYCK